MGQFCGTTLPGVVETTTSELKIVFTSDSIVSQRGFRLSHETVGEFAFYLNWWHYELLHGIYIACLWQIT